MKLSLAALFFAPAAVFASEEQPRIEWMKKVSGNRAVRGTFYSSTMDTLFAFCTYGDGAAIYHIDPATGEETFVYAIPPAPEVSPSEVASARPETDDDDDDSIAYYANATVLADEDRPHFGSFSLGVYEPESGLQYLVVNVQDWNKRGRLISYDPSRREQNWEVPTPSPPGFDQYHYSETVGIPPITADGDIVYAGQPHGRVMAIDAGSGAVRWEAETGILQIGGMALSPDEGTLYVGARRRDGNGVPGLYAVSTDDGSIVGEYLTDQDRGIQSEPAVSGSGDSVYVSDANLGLCMYDPINLANGPVWQNAFGTDPRFQSTSQKPELSMNEEDIYATARYNVARVGKNGNTIWRDDWNTGETAASQLVLSPDEEYIYAMHNRGWDRSVRQANTTNGVVVWELPAADGSDWRLQLNEDGTRLYYGDERGRLFSVDTTTLATPTPTSQPTSSPTDETAAPSSTPSAEAAKSCTESGGFVSRELCRKFLGDYPNTCEDGDSCPCTSGCSPADVHFVMACICPDKFCFDGIMCTAVTPAPTNAPTTPMPTSMPSASPTDGPTDPPSAAMPTRRTLGLAIAGFVTSSTFFLL